MNPVADPSAHLDGGYRSVEMQEISTSNLVIRLQKLAKNASYYKPGHRQQLLAEAADRLQAYRNAERQMTGIRRFT